MEKTGMKVKYSTEGESGQNASGRMERRMQGWGRARLSYLIQAVAYPLRIFRNFGG